MINGKLRPMENSQQMKCKRTFSSMGCAGEGGGGVLSDSKHWLDSPCSEREAGFERKFQPFESTCHALRKDSDRILVVPALTFG